MSCNSYEKLGDFKYKVTIERVNTGDFGGVVDYMKFYHHPVLDTSMFGYVIKSQRLDFETKKDTVFTIGKFKYDKINKSITTVEIYQNGYEKYVELDSIVRILMQKNDGSIIYKDYIQYLNGKEIYRDSFKKLKQ